MAQFQNIYPIDLNIKKKGAQELLQPIGEGDANGVRVGAQVFADGAPVTLNGQCVAKVIRADGSTVPLTGTISGNIASVALDQQSCAVEGPIQVAVMWVSGTNVTTLVIAYGTIVNTISGTIIQPSTPIPDLTQLLAEIEAMRQATAAANAAATKAVRYNEAQSLTDTEKARARGNISAPSAADLAATNTALSNLSASAATKAELAALADGKAVRYDTAQTLVPSQMRRGRDNLNAADALEANIAGSNFMGNDLFMRGSLDQGTVTDVQYRIVLRKIARLTFPVTVVARTGFRVYVATYYETGNYRANSGWQTSYTIPKDTNFRITVARDPDDTTETATINTFTGNVIVYHGEVRYDSTQALSEASQAQARTNIGAPSAADLAATNTALSNLSASAATKAELAALADGAMTNFAGAFVQATAYPAGTYVTYTDGHLYILPNGHEANATWANTTKTQVSVGGELSELKGAFVSKLAPVASYLTDWTQGYIRSDGTDGDSSNTCRQTGYHQYSEFSNIGIAFTVKSGYKIQLNEYTGQTVNTFIGRVTSDYIDGTFTLNLNPTRYYKATIKKTDDSAFTFRDIPSDVLLFVDYQATDKTLSQADKAADAKATGDNISIIKNRFVPANLFDKDSSGCVADSYLNVSNGQPATLVGCTVSDYIDVTGYSQIMASGTHIICFYNSAKEFTTTPPSMDSRHTDLTITIPSGAEYLRFSTFNSYIPTAQIGKNVSRSEYIQFGKFTMPDLIVRTVPIVVDANGNGDYTSLTLALKEHVDETAEIKVLPGTYDIVAEYNTIWGTSAVDDMSDSSTDFNGFQFGIIIRNKKIEFLPGAVVVCDWHYKSDGATARTVNGTHRFSPIRVDYNCEIIGLNMVCSYSFYAVHDDYGLTEQPYTVKYKNCVVNGEYLHQQNVIGGGTKKYSRHIIENCYFNNGEHSNIHTVRYHNTNQAGAVPEIYISNTYFNGTFTARWYGTQTSKMRVYVNNCMARTIYTMQEADGYTTENVDLFKWCNEETNPVD